MAFRQLTVDETNSLSPVTVDLWTAVKDNFIDHELRVGGVEGLTASANNDHFDDTNGSGAISTVRWKSAGAGSVTLQTTSHTVIQAGTSGQDSRIRSNLRSFPVWRPKYVTRVKFSAQANINELFLGLQLDRATTIGEGADGVWLVFPTAADPFFRARKTAAGTTDSATLTDPGDNTWFEVSIEWTADDTVSCKLDGVERIISTNVPDTTEQLFAETHFQTDGTGTLTVDRIEHRNTILADTV